MGGELGTSFRNGQPVLDLLLDRLVPTSQLVGVVVVGSAVFALVLGFGLSEDLAFRSRKAIALVGLADVSLKLRRYDEAITTATDAAAVAGTGGNLAAEVDALNVLGAANLARGGFTKAVSRHRQALDSASVAGYLRGRAEALIGLSPAVVTISPAPPVSPRTLS